MDLTLNVHRTAEYGVAVLRLSVSLRQLIDMNDAIASFDIKRFKKTLKEIQSFPENEYSPQAGDIFISDLTLCKSAAGWYAGRNCCSYEVIGDPFEVDCGFTTWIMSPYDRDSHYTDEETARKWVRQPHLMIPRW